MSGKYASKEDLVEHKPMNSNKLGIDEIAVVKG